MNTPKTPDMMQTFIMRSIEHETKTIVEEEAVEASKRVEKRVRGLMGQIVTKIASYTEYRDMTDRLIITVRFPDDKNNL